MHALVVYESHWGNTEAVARAIAEGLGPGTRAVTTADATPDIVAAAELLVAGAPVMAFGLPTERMVENLEQDRKAPSPPADAWPPMRTWLEDLAPGHGRSAAFETRLWWSPRGATGAIERSLAEAGYEPAAKAARFVVTGAYGPLRAGELERGRAWGAELARTMGA